MAYLDAGIFFTIKKDLAIYNNRNEPEGHLETEQNRCDHGGV